MSRKENNISIIWDFDGTLTPDDSTSKTVEFLGYEGGVNHFWAYIKSLRGDKKQPKWEHVLASDAPIWLYALSKLAHEKKVPLNTEFFKEFILPNIKLFPNVIPFLKKLKNLEKNINFQNVNLRVHHFIVSAGLQELVCLPFPDDLITWTFGCRYAVLTHHDDPEKKLENVPVFCMDETMKTRSIFEIAKGSFDDEKKGVNARVPQQNIWSPFSNMIYIGDGMTDVPAMALIRDRGGIGIAVHDPSYSPEKVKKKHAEMRLDKRADFITEADFKLGAGLYKYIETRCIQIRQRYEAEQALL